jgi:SSS family solute:Na+ symporter
LTLTLAIILGWLALTTTVGVLAGLGRRFSLEGFFVGDRSFGTVLFYTLAAAEIYSAYAFLGLAGWAYAKGVSIVYALAYMSIAYGLYFFVGPRIQRLGRRGGYVTQADFIEDRYGSRALGCAVALVGVAAMMPYLQVQLVGSGIIVELASAGAMSRETAIVVAVVALVVFVSFSGLRGIGWTNLMQAVIMLVAMLTVGALVPRLLFGGVEPAMAALARLRPQHLALPDSGGFGIGWYASTVLLSAIGAWMWPHIFATTYGAKSERVVRRNAGVLPLYQLATVPILLVGLVCAAKAAEDPGFAQGIAHPDHVMLRVLVEHFPPWIAGMIGAGGLAAAVSTASALILGAANLLARNVAQKGLAPALDDRRTAWLARGLVLVVAAVALALALHAPAMLVNLLLIGYSGIAQLAPAVLLGMFSRRPTLAGVSAGLAVGIAFATTVQLAGLTLPFRIHAGLAALALNLAVVLVVDRFAREPDADRVARFERLLAE